MLGLAAQDHDSATVDGIVHSTDPAAALEPVEYGRYGTRGQTNSIRQLSRRHRPKPANEIHTLSVGTVHPEAVGNGLVHKVQLAIQGSDFLEGLFDESLLRIAV